jgi:hypothetical protein
MKFMDVLRETVVKAKFYMTRTMSYMSLINTGMILFLFLSNLERYNLDIEIQEWIIPIFIVGVCGMMLFGFIEDKLGFYRHEQKTVHTRSPVFNEILERLDRIEGKLKNK